jgi:hypothetical protein
MQLPSRMNFAVILILNIANDLHLRRACPRKSGLRGKALRSIRILLPGLLSIGLAQPASAAEAPSFDWSGLYVGGHVAYGRGHTSNTLFDPDPTQSDRSFSSLYGGLQMGYNYVLPSRVLLGAEADVSFPNFLEDDLISSRTTAQGTNVTDQIEYVATLRGRAGYTFDDLADLRDRRIRLVASAVH